MAPECWEGRSEGTEVAAVVAAVVAVDGILARWLGHSVSGRR
jgi:hypothetical protein